MSTSRNAPSKMKPALALAGIVLVALAIALGTSGGGDTSGTGAAAFGEPVVTGTALSPLRDPAQDPTVGSPAPTVTGETTTGEALTIGASDRPTIVAFLAHWCPHCRAEVPVVVDWLRDGGLPDTVQMVAVATATDEGQANFPPATWLEAEGFTPPVLLDDEADTAGSAYGVSSFPFWVVLDADGTVLLRTSGELTPNQLDALVGLALGG